MQIGRVTSTSAAQAAAPARRTRIVAAVAAMAGLMFGLDIGVISGAEQWIQKEFAIPDHTIEQIVGAMMLGAALGAFIAGWLSYALGRKRALMLGGVLFVLGSLLCAWAWSPQALIGARLMLGLAIGIAAFAAPMYIAEIAPEEKRGSMITAYQLMITIGILLAFLSDTAFSASGAWRWMLGIIALPGLVFLLGVLVLPDSPRWLVLRGRRDEAERVLLSLRGDADVVRRELAQIDESNREQQLGWRLFLRNGNFRRSVGLGMLLQVMQQLTGMNVVMYYAPRIFGSMGYATGAQMWFTAIVGLTNVLATLIALHLVDRWGRRPILFVGFVIMALGMGAVGAVLHAGTDSAGMQLFAVAMLLVFIVGFAMSAGPLIWTLCSEIQPLHGRDFGIAASTLTNWIANMLVGASFLTLLETIGNAWTFWLYAGLNVVFLWLSWLLVPETRGVSLEQIERHLMAGRKLRQIGR